MESAMPPPPAIPKATVVTEKELESESSRIADEMMGEEACEIDPVDNGPMNEECLDEATYRSTYQRLKSLIKGTAKGVADDVDEDQEEEVSFGEILEQGWEKRGSSSALRRNSEGEEERRA